MDLYASHVIVASSRTSEHSQAPTFAAPVYDARERDNALAGKIITYLRQTAFDSKAARFHPGVCVAQFGFPALGYQNSLAPHAKLRDRGWQGDVVRKWRVGSVYMCSMRTPQLEPHTLFALQPKRSSRARAPKDKTGEEPNIIHIHSSGTTAPSRMSFPAQSFPGISCPIV